jgi:hypothetical protein
MRRLWSGSSQILRHIMAILPSLKMTRWNMSPAIIQGVEKYPPSVTTKCYTYGVYVYFWYLFMSRKMVSLLIGNAG